MSETQSIARHNELLTEFEKHTEERRREFARYDKKEPIILVALNSGYEKLFRNFLCSTEANHLNNIVFSNLYVIPCELGAARMLYTLDVPHSRANGWMEKFKIMESFQGTNVSVIQKTICLNYSNELFVETDRAPLLDQRAAIRRDERTYPRRIQRVDDGRGYDL